MKKCLYCSSAIEDEDAFCRHCGKRQGNVNELTLNDLDNLSEKWTQSYSRFPHSATDKIMGQLTRFMKEELSKIFAEYFRYKLINDAEYQKILMQIMGPSLQWALICFEIGVEAGLKKINDKDVPVYTIHISKPYRDALAIWVIRLLSEGKIKSKLGNSLIEMINDNVVKLAVNFANLGFVYCGEVDAKGDGMEFNKALRKIISVEN